MGKVHEFMNSNRICRRWELDGRPVQVIEKQGTTPYRGVDHPTVITIWKGLHMLDTGRGIWQVDQSTTCDAGPKLGTALIYDVHPAVPATEEERQANRRALDLVIRQIRPGWHLVDDPA